MPAGRFCRATATEDEMPATATTGPTADTYHHGDLRAACIDAGIRLVEEGGPDAVTIRGVARLAGVSHQAPLHHFRDRDALIHEIAERGFEMLTARLDREVPADTSPTIALRGYGLVYVLQAVEHPGLFQLMFAPCDEPTGEAAYRRLVELCGAAQAARELRGDDPLRLAMLLWGLVHGVAALYTSMGLESGLSGQPVEPRVAAEHALDDLLGALRADS
jgi:AcrR family transcriptional regulator